MNESMRLIRYPKSCPNRSRLAPPVRVMGNLRFMGIPNWVAYAAILIIFILQIREYVFP